MHYLSSIVISASLMKKILMNILMWLEYGEVYLKLYNVFLPELGYYEVCKFHIEWSAKLGRVFKCLVLPFKRLAFMCGFTKYLYAYQLVSKLVVKVSKMTTNRVFWLVEGFD